MKFPTIVCVLVLLASGLVSAQENPVWRSLIGSAFVDNQSYLLLQKLCDEAGGRLTGSVQNEKAMDILQEELEKAGYQVVREKFKMPGWLRGNDEVLMTAPVVRRLKAAALGYSPSHPSLDAPVVYAEYGVEENYQNLDAKDKVVLVRQNRPHTQGMTFKSEILDIATKHGARAVLFIAEKPGNLVQVSTSNYNGSPTPIPGYSVTLEEGKWMERLLKRSVPVTVRIKTESICQEVETANLVATLPGKVSQKIVLGAHFDSWDIGQGAIDNGTGTAILFDVARLLKRYSLQNHFTLEFVWFNGEEQGLFGAKQYVRTHPLEDIVAMINMDMTGSPTGFNVMGCDEAIPFLQNLAMKLNGMDLKGDVSSAVWMGSDHFAFLLKGIPAITPSGYLEDERVRYYHDTGDTFDKVSKKYLSEAAAVVSILALEMANLEKHPFRQKGEKEIVELMKKFKMEDRLKWLKEWPFDK
jgi:Iap family predicted aminopeptidase